MAAARSKAPAIGSSQWILQERHFSNDLVTEELEDFGFSVRNELEWLNEHMAEIFAHNGQHNLDVFKTPGKLRGKTPRTARKKPAEGRQPLGDIFSPNAQHRPSPAQQSLKNNLQKNLAKARFQVAEDAENVAPAQSPAAKSPLPRPLFSKAIPKEKESSNSAHHKNTVDDRKPERQPAPRSSMQSTQDTVMSSHDDVFSPPQTQSTQPTQATMSFGRSIQMVSDDERRDTDESFVSAKEAFGSKRGSKNPSHDVQQADAMDVDDDNTNLTRSESQDTVIHHEIDSDNDMIPDTLPEFPQPPTAVFAATNQPTHSPVHKKLFSPSQSLNKPIEKPTVSPEAEHDDTVVHHEVDDQMDIDDDVRSPSDGSSPVKPLVRKSSLAFAPLPAREPLTAKKSMGNRVSRTSHFDQNKDRNSNLGRFTGGKSLGGSQVMQPTESLHDPMDLDEERAESRREGSESTKIHNKTSTQRLYERINMLKQQNEAPKRTSQNIYSQASQSQSFASSLPKDTAHPTQASQPTYPDLPAAGPEKEEDDDDWISPIRTTAPVPNPVRPPFSKSHSADTRPAAIEPVVVKPISVSNPDLSTVVESTTPAGSPTALRAAKEKIIGSSATSAQVKLDALAESPVRPRLFPQGSSEDIFTSPKRNDKAGTSLFSHLRSPSKESVKSSKTTKVAAVPGSPTKDDGRRTRSSSERERQREKDAREKETKQKQRADERLKEMRDKEQSKAAAQYQKSKAAASKTPSHMASAPNMRQAAATTAKTPISVSSQAQAHSRPGTIRMNTAQKPQDPDSADEMPPPPPPKSLLPTTKTSSKASLREPKKLVKTSSKDTLAKTKPPQKIMVNLGNSRYGPAPPPAARPAPSAPKAAPSVASVASKPAPAAPKPAPSAAPRPASALSSKSGPSSRPAPSTAKTVARVGRPQPQVVEKPKAAPATSRPDIAPSKPLNAMRTVEDANRIKVPAINPAKPAKRPFQAESDESLHRPAKRPSQQAKMNPITPAHAQFAKGKIPFAEPAHPPQHKTPQSQYANGEDIKLPEIMTDSEDEDSENEFEQPDWVNTPNLRELLTSQQLMDPEQIFGPIAPLNMEQVFPNKERHKRFRERTSSAYWANDQVTEEEKRKEREARERLVREGAWTYNPSPRPAR